MKIVPHLPPAMNTMEFVCLWCENEWEDYNDQGMGSFFKFSSMKFLNYHPLTDTYNKFPEFSHGKIQLAFSRNY